MAILKSLPGSYPAFLTASRIVSIASSSDFSAGAKPPSSPTDVASPRSFRMAASAWNTSAHHLKHSLKEGAPTGIIMNSCTSNPDDTARIAFAPSLDLSFVPSAAIIAASTA